MDIRASGTKRPAGPLPPLTWSSCPPPLRLDSPSFQHHQPYSPTAGSSHWKQAEPVAPACSWLWTAGSQAATCSSELSPSHQVGPRQAAQPSCPALGPRRGSAAWCPPPPNPWPKYNLSRRLAGNRDLCQSPAGAGGRKVSMIGRDAGWAGSQTWVM